MNKEHDEKAAKQAINYTKENTKSSSGQIKYQLHHKNKNKSVNMKIDLNVIH